MVCNEARANCAVIRSSDNQRPLKSMARILKVLFQILTQPYSL